MIVLQSGKLLSREENRAPDRAAHGCNQIAGTSIWLCLRSQERLAHAVVSCDGRDGKADFSTDPAPFVVPDFFGQEIRCQAARDREFRGVGFTDSISVNGACHGVEQISHEDAFELLPAIDGRDQVEVVVVDRTDKPLEPVRFDGCRIG